MYKFIGNGEHGVSPVETIFSVSFVFVAGLLINWIFGQYVLFAKNQIEGSTSQTATDK